jgi:hypothetical protein
MDAVASSRDINVPMRIAVADESGNLIEFARMDGGKISRISYNHLCVPGQPTFGIHVSNGQRLVSLAVATGDTKRRCRCRRRGSAQERPNRISSLLRRR